MTVKEIQQRFEKCIDQYYAQLKYMDPNYRKETEMLKIGGMLQAALHVLPNKNYFELNEYVYTKHGYDPGGVKQMTMQEWEAMDDKEVEE